MAQEDIMDGFASNIKREPKRDYQINPRKPKDAGNVLKAIQDGKIGSIKEVIDEIQVMIGNRQQLSKEFLADIDKIIMDINNMMIKIGNTMTPEAINLVDKKIELQQNKTKEKIDSWRDIANLQRELRERIQDFRDKESKINMIDNLLDDD